MEVKEIYLNERKVEKKGKTTFIIENDWNGKELLLKIGYEDKELQEVRDIKESCKAMESNIESLLTTTEEKEDKAREVIKEYEKEIKTRQKINDKLEKELQESDKKQKSISYQIEMQDKASKRLSEAIDQIVKRIDEIEKKATKQIKVYHDKIFISWNEEVMLGLYDIPDWDYLSIINIKIGEHNEYCDNKDEVIVNNIHSEDWFTPRYQLYGWTDLDTPTATVYYDLILIPTECMFM